MDAYRRIGTVAAAVKVAGIDRRTHYKWRKADKAYAAAFAEAHEDFVDSLEQEAFRRGVVGWDEPVVYLGAYRWEADPTTGQQRQVVVRKFDSTLLMQRLNAERPEKYRYRHEHAGPGGGPIPHAHSGALVTVPATADTKTFLAAMRQIQQAAAKAAGDGHGDGQPATTDGGAGRG